MPKWNYRPDTTHQIVADSVAKSDAGGGPAGIAIPRYAPSCDHRASESQTSDQTIMAIAGHVSPRMLAHYSHVRLEAKRKALNALSRQSSGRSYDTNRDTKEPSDPIQLPQLIEKNGGADGARTRDLLRDRQAF
jgi:hypothetical protein